MFDVGNLLDERDIPLDFDRVIFLAQFVVDFGADLGEGAVRLSDDRPRPPLPLLKS